MHFRLAEEIINLSESKEWDFAKLEWSFEFAYYADELQKCLCGHYPIKNICVIKNQKNSFVTEVGNCCINKFLGIEDGNKIFSSIKKLKENIAASMSAEVIEYIYRKKGISDFDYKFYKSIYRRRIMSTKQCEIKKRINQQFLNFTSYETNSHFNKINLVLKWAETNTSFNTDFILSIKKTCRQKGRLTEKQLESLNKIIRDFKIK
ncbi:hypothetical protein [Chryseobacterium salivictor]|uniref:Uncharacterized protein n=1 Tax=Chryseobacterium salivictor TaxID=2547600 RepID=A0A4P6ZI97_9FLAO|nr:hypothetical protein [Chryseobacterium salivictor]QBO59586.1 hypothetical protein NBC122_02785 [Chryseobacterium salivictor]